MVKRGVSSKVLFGTLQTKTKLLGRKSTKMECILLDYFGQNFQGRYFVVPGLDLTIMISHNE